ncbi:MAG: hypothetical protein KatS3mg097_557 [Candidatus Parcubacteria bacterium]|nr:MAG: hypothetical protein KatS3mg097_557 [Candidatus Parcubacteria bacterium]
MEKENFISFIRENWLRLLISILLFVAVSGIIAGFFMRMSQNKQFEELKNEMNQSFVELFQASQEAKFCLQSEFLEDKKLIEECYTSLKNYKEKFNEVQLLLGKITDYFKKYQKSISDERDKKFIGDFIRFFESNYYKDMRDGILIYAGVLINFFDYLRTKDLDNLTNPEKAELRELIDDVANTENSLIIKAKRLKNFLYENFDEEFINYAKKYMPQILSIEDTLETEKRDN